MVSSRQKKLINIGHCESKLVKLTLHCDIGQPIAILVCPDCGWQKNFVSAGCISVCLVGQCYDMRHNLLLQCYDMRHNLLLQCYDMRHNLLLQCYDMRHNLLLQSSGILQYTYSIKRPDRYTLKP